MTQRRDLQALIDAAPVGKMQWRVIICCFLVVMLDGFDTAAIGFIAPDIRTHWQLSASELAPLLLGVLMDRLNPFRVLAVSYALGAVCIVMIGLSENGLWLMALAIFGTGIGISGSQVGLNALTATLYPTQSRATGVSWSNAIGRCGAIVGSLSGGMMMALNFSFDTLFFVIAIPAAISAVMLTLLTVVVRLSISVPDDLPRASVVNE
ncbi:aromatic acid/H+ symport family MFS transporter [Salmonella enterica subsp. enterica]|nr:aromatic acid/H+ symport family MFS transporter [Salmonella enterica subsp. enterica]